MMVLEDDLLTVKGEAKLILPPATKRNGFKGHAFFEGASIRKVKDMYYFIYSSEKNHELCYATSKYPDRDFIYGGTIISNGDEGYESRKGKHRLNATGTTHGSIEYISGQWYVFYHRLTHGSDYSRQACAEPIEIATDGRIAQVEMTSCGLNLGYLRAESTIPATKACNITNGHMPHISNRKYEKTIPMVTHDDKVRYIANIENGTTIGFKYFSFTKSQGKIQVTFRGNGKGNFMSYLEVAPLYFVFQGIGNIELLEFSIY